MSLRELHDRAGSGKCVICDSTRPPGRTLYCSETCWQIGAARREQERQAARRTACAGCGGPKAGPGETLPRGRRLCAECLRLRADSSAAREFERSRRRQAARYVARLSAGDRLRCRTADAPEGHKWCPRCQAFRPETSFPRRSDDGKAASYCKPCQRSYNQERRLKIVYGLTWDEYDFLLTCQDGKCAICLSRPRKFTLAVDHDHKTGEIRGLLCRRCNHRLLGSARDDVQMLRRAIDYLEAYSPRDVFGEPKFMPGFADGTAP